MRLLNVWVCRRTERGEKSILMKNDRHSGGSLAKKKGALFELIYYL